MTNCLPNSIRRLNQVADSLVAQSNEFKAAAAASPSQTLARGVIADGGSQSFESRRISCSSSIDVKVGQMIQLTIDPQTNYGADTTLIEWTFTEIGGAPAAVESARRTSTADFLAANPHADRLGNPAVWLFLDGRGGPSLLPEPVRDAVGKPGLHAWRNGENPAVMVNSTKEPIPAWTTLPAGVRAGASGAGWTGRASPGSVRSMARSLAAVASSMRIPAAPTASAGPSTGSAASIHRRCSGWPRPARSESQLTARKAELVAHAPAREVAYGVTEGTVANARLHLRGDPEKLGEEVPRRWLELFGGQAGARRRRQRTPATGPVADRPGQSAGRPSHGQPHLAASFRQGAGADPQRFWDARPAAHASRTARLAGGAIPGVAAGASNRCTA